MKKYPAVQLSGLSNVARLVDSPDELFAQLKDGSWVGISRAVYTALGMPFFHWVEVMRVRQQYQQR
ncbi:hypothetical protein [Paenibacillus sp. NPDC055715]